MAHMNIRYELHDMHDVVDATLSTSCTVDAMLMNNKISRSAVIYPGGALDWLQPSVAWNDLDQSPKSLGRHQDALDGGQMRPQKSAFCTV